MYEHGKASFLVGGQWGSEGKGAAAAWLAAHLTKFTSEGFDIVTTNAGAQAGHTSTFAGEKRVVYHLPTYPLIARAAGAEFMPLSYLNAGSIIDPVVLLKEIEEQELEPSQLAIHPNAAVITEECREAEGREDSAQTKIASTRKGVGEALARKVLRSGKIVGDLPGHLKPYVRKLDLNDLMLKDHSVLVEVPQGISLSVNSRFYPYCTSRNCTVQQAMADAEIHPSFVGKTMLVLRTYPIRVGHIRDGSGGALGQSGPGYHDQRETSWDALGQTPEITTVTGRVRRVFTFSKAQVREAMALTRPDVVYLTFCDYCSKAEVEAIKKAIQECARKLKMTPPLMRFQYGPTTGDVYNVVQNDIVQGEK